MKNYYLIILVSILIPFTSFSQLDQLIVDEYVHDGSIPETAGMTTYRIYAQCVSALDFVTEVTGAGDPDECSGNISTSTSFYRNNIFVPGITGKDVNSALGGIPGFEHMEWVSYVTIGWSTSSTVGIPFSENSLGNLPLSASGGVSTVGEWESEFSEGGNINLNTGFGGAWFSLNGDANGYGVGVNNSVLLGQFTTDGEFTYEINVSVIPDEAPFVHYSHCEDEISGLVYPITNYCTDSEACNFNPEATEDDGSCAYLGDDCNDYDSSTIDDVYIVDCECEGVLTGCTVPSACNYNSEAVEDNGSCFYVGDPCNDGDSNTGNDQIIGNCECEGLLYGCTDESACNYDELAGINSGCIYPGASCDDDNEFTFDDVLQEDCSCAGEYEGCTEPNALNYDVTSTEPCNGDNSCCVFAPENDFIENAIELTVEDWTECSYTEGNTIYASDSPESSESRLDVWYEFTAEFSCLEVIVNPSEEMDVIWSLYDSNLELISSQDEGLAGTQEQAFISVAPGEIHYINVADWSAEGEGEFELCIQEMSLYAALAIGCLEGGCTDSEACNYDSQVVEDNGTCYYPDELCDDFDDTTAQDIVGDNCQCQGLYLGCMDTEACNYDDQAQLDDNSCYYIGGQCAYQDGGAAVVGSYNSDCECVGNEINEVLGCLDSEACNYNSNALINNGCLYVGDSCDDENASTINDGYDSNCNCSGEDPAAVLGCTDAAACNFELSATEDDGSCLYSGDTCDDGNNGTDGETYDNNCNCIVVDPDPESGCTDSNACNYDENAEIEDGSCYYQGDSCNDGNQNTVNDVINSSCSCTGELIIEGCIDSTACNYNSEATVSNDNCTYTGDSCNDGNNFSINDVLDENCNCTGEFIEIVNGCTDSEACNYNPEANSDNGTCGYIGQTCDDGNNATNNETYQADCECIGDILGCTDPIACNFNPTATLDNGACTYPGSSCNDGNFNTGLDAYDEFCNCVGLPLGCTDPGACNFEPWAQLDDDSCDYPGDVCNDFNSSTWFDELNDNCDCVGLIHGCIDETACNFSNVAEVGDSSCEYPGDSCDNGLGALSDDCECLFTISGYAFIDNDYDGELDSDEYPIANHQVVLEPLGIQAFTNMSGYYYFDDLPAGSYFATINYQVVWEIYTTDVTHDIALPPNFFDLTNFGVTNTSAPVPTGSVSITPETAGVQCNSNDEYDVRIYNTTPYPISGVVEFIYDEEYFNYSSSDPIADSLVDNRVYMSYSSLDPYHQNWDEVILVSPDEGEFGNQTLNEVNLYAWHNGELVLIDSDSENEEIVCAYDPNDITGYPLGYTDEHWVLPDTRMEYVIRFQNTGNAPAETVLIVDTLDEHMNKMSFELVSYTHNVNTSIDENGVVSFLFENINLPDSTENEPDSHGMVSFKIDFVDDIPIGEEVNQTAYIFFDNNPAIVTNTTWHTIHECGGEAAFGASATEVCVGESVSFNSTYSQIEEYDWRVNGELMSTESSYEHLFEEGGTYAVQFISMNPICAENNVQMITVYNLPTSEITENGAMLTATEGTSYQWYQNGEAINGATDQEYEALEDGVYTVEVTNENNCSTVSEGVMVVGVNELEELVILLYPNPMTDVSVLEMSNSKVKTVDLLDSRGRVVRSWGNVTDQRIEIERGDLSSGTYFITITEGNSQKTMSLLVK